MNWLTWVFFLCLVWGDPGEGCTCCRDKTTSEKLRQCFLNENTTFVVPGYFSGFINASGHGNHSENVCIVFLQKAENRSPYDLRYWPQIKEKDSASLLYISNWHIQKRVKMRVLQGINCSAIGPKYNESCWVTLDTAKCGELKYDDNFCNQAGTPIKNKYIINITATNISCYNCDNPVKEPEEKFEADDLKHFNISSNFDKKEVLASEAAELMNQISNLATAINASSAAVTLGDGVTGVIVRETVPEDIKEVSFAYGSTDENINIVNTRDSLTSFSRSVTVPKEAFEKSVNSKVAIPFAALFRFTNMTNNETDRNVLDNEVLAVEMGVGIKNLTDRICINFRKLKYEGIPSCLSWNGEGSQPNWTGDGCQTIQDGENITCQCSHLTFFAILLAPPNQTIPSSDLKTLTTITQVGCGLSIFFLSIILFRHFLLRRTKASVSTRFLINLVSAMTLLNLTFLTNNFVADLKNSVGCKIMAALMHYFMLAMFTWFAVQAFHLCMQLHTGGKVAIRYYMLKVCIISWALPSLVAIILLIKGKYGEQVIYVNDSEANKSMCWITDTDVHYVVNIGYYALVFLFTFTTFIIIVSWLFCLKRTNAGNANTTRSGQSIVVILGLCCMLGITWGFAFFAHGAFLIPAFYIFTILNSFQGFFLFIYHHKTSNLGELHGSENVHKNSGTTSSISTGTLNTTVDNTENPYSNIMTKK